MAGYLDSIAEVIHAEIFSDMLKAASDLSVKGYYVPAGVLTGAVLEEHLRKLAIKENIKIEEKGKPRTATPLNNDLHTQGVFTRVVHAKVEGLIAIRNKAAHGHFGEFTQADVRQMVDAVLDLIDRFPA